MNRLVGVTVFLVALLLAGTLYGWPLYRVWEQGLEGEAELAKAGQNRKIRTLEAEAKKDSAKLEAEAEALRAEGLAKANKILGESLAGARRALLALPLDHGARKGRQPRDHLHPHRSGPAHLGGEPTDGQGDGRGGHV